MGTLGNAEAPAILAGSCFFDECLSFRPCIWDILEILGKEMNREREDEMHRDPEFHSRPAGGKVCTLCTTAQKMDDALRIGGLFLDTGKSLLDEWLAICEIGGLTPINAGLWPVTGKGDDEYGRDDGGIHNC